MSDATGFTLLVFLSVVAILIWLLPVAGKWKVYGKLGMPGWYSIIPVYADYKLCERVHRGDETRTFLMAYLIVLICSWAFCCVDTVGVLLALAQLVMRKETGYTIGLVIFGFVFWTMLGFGASEPVDSDGDETE